MGISRVIELHTLTGNIIHDWRRDKAAVGADPAVDARSHAGVLRQAGGLRRQRELPETHR